jgi:FKBP-type peptidyl-prolyl cis-trans isomerase FkpA
MRILLTAAIAVTLLSTSCVDKNEDCQYRQSTVLASTSETSAIQNYLTMGGVTGATQHPCGAFYKIITQGTGAKPVSLCSGISVNYTGKVFGAASNFDASTPGSPANFTLGQLIAGWQRMLPELSSGGRIILYIPPSLGYGSQAIQNGGVTIIPANSYLEFDISLTAVTNP